MRIIINFGLTLVLFGLLILPVTVNYLAISVAGGNGIVAGVRLATEKEINILPNFRDFNGFVSFSPAPFKDGKYADNVGVKVFQRQKASYKGLYTVYNLAEQQSLSVVINTTGVGPQESFSSMVISIAKDEHAQTLQTEADKAATLLKVTNPIMFKEEERVMVGTELTQIVAVTDESLVVTPLHGIHLAGEMVYHEPIMITSDRLVNPQTQTIVLAPGEKATVNVIVEGTADLRVPDQMVYFPLTFKVRPVD